MRKLALVILAMMICVSVYAQDRTVVIPDTITEQEAKEWLSILHERKVQAQINNIPEVAKAAADAKGCIDAYREKVGLTPKFKAVEPIEEPKPVVEEQIVP